MDKQRMQAALSDLIPTFGTNRTLLEALWPQGPPGCLPALFVSKDTGRRAKLATGPVWGCWVWAYRRSR